MRGCGAGGALVAVDEVDVVAAARRVKLDRPEDVVGPAAVRQKLERLVARGRGREEHRRAELLPRHEEVAEAGRQRAAAPRAVGRWPAHRRRGCGVGAPCDEVLVERARELDGMLRPVVAHLARVGRVLEWGQLAGVG